MAKPGLYSTYPDFILLFYFTICLFKNYSRSIPSRPYLTQSHFFILAADSICIAAAGYIINDYFDLNIDQVNKPEKLIIEKYIKRRWAIVFHVLLSFTGFILSCYVAWHINNIYLPFFNLLSILALWFYSTTFKKKILIGNVLVSFLTAWVILIITIAEYHYTVGIPNMVAKPCR